MHSDKGKADSMDLTARTDRPENGPQPSNIPLWRDQRRFRRVRLTVEARFLLPDQSEHCGAVLDISAGGVAISSDVKPEVTDKVVVYIDQMGGYEGKIVRIMNEGFSVEFKSSPVKRERTVDRLTWLTNKSDDTAMEERQHDREAVIKNSTLHRPDGSCVKCCVMDMSIGGLAVKIADKPPIGEIITIGQMEGRVVRHFAEGVGIEFLNLPQRRRALTQSLF